MADQTFDDLAVDPNNPNTEVDGRDFLAWQRGYATDDGLLLPAVQDNGLLLPAVQDDGLLLPAVRTDDGLLLPAVQTDEKSLQEWPIGPLPEFQTDDGLLLPAVQDEGLLLPAVQTGGVVVASGDVNGDDGKPDLLVGRSGSDWTLDFQPQLTTEPTAPEAFKFKTVFTTKIDWSGPGDADHRAHGRSRCRSEQPDTVI